jgi:hypothetical protein
MSNDGPVTEIVNYFFYKCGEANCWLPVALEGHGLYFGFVDNVPPAPTGTHGIVTREPEATLQTLTEQDDDKIAWLTLPNNRPRFLLLTFAPVECVALLSQSRRPNLDVVDVHLPGRRQPI